MGVMKGLGVVLLVGFGIGFCAMKQEENRRADLTPAELAAEDSAREARLAADKAEEQRTPAYQMGLAHFAVKRRAKDPDAVQFRNEQLYQRGDTLIVCGEANLKNGFGGYIGFKPYVMVRGAVVMESDANEVGADVVNEFFKKCSSR